MSRSRTGQEPIDDHDTFPSVNTATAHVMAAPPVTAETMAPDRPFMALPLHLVAEILTQLGSVQHLPSALLTHPVFYAAYQDFPSLVHSALREQIVDDEVYMLALIAYESDPARRSKKGVLPADFVATYRDNPADIIFGHRYIKLYEALRLGEFHKITTELRDSFVARTLTRLYDRKEADAGQVLEPEDVLLSDDESRRIERALYRFQIYCNLFSDVFREGGREDTGAKSIFYDKHSSWVNEQLSTVHDFLEGELHTVIQSVAAAYADEAPWLIDGDKGRRKQRYLSLGLPWLHQLFTSPVDKQFDILVEAKDFHGSAQKVAPPMPPTPLKEKHKAAGDAPPLREPPSEWHDQTNLIMVEHDADCGPELLWKETHPAKPTEKTCLVEHCCALRLVGYVMWDVCRTTKPKMNEFGEQVADKTYIETIQAAQSDSTPTFFSKSRFMNPAYSWEKQLRVPQRPAGPAAATGRRGSSARSFTRSQQSVSAVARGKTTARPAPAPRAGGRAFPSKKTLQPPVAEGLTSTTSTATAVLPVAEDVASTGKLERAGNSIKKSAPLPIIVPAIESSALAVPGAVPVPEAAPKAPAMSAATLKVPTA